MLNDHLTLVDVSTFKKKVNDGDKALENLGIHKEYPSSVKQIGDNSLEFIISTDDVDRDRDKISVNGWDLKNYKKNPVVLFAHDGRQPPIAKASNIRVEGNRLISEAEFTPADLFPFGHMIFRMYKEKFLNATSVGFRPLKFEFVDDDEDRFGGIDFLKQELLEFSAVPIPANPMALVQAHSAGISTNSFRKWVEEVIEQKDLLPTKGVDVVALEAAWKDSCSTGFTLIDLWDKDEEKELTPAKEGVEAKESEGEVEEPTGESTTESPAEEAVDVEVTETADDSSAENAEDTVEVDNAQPEPEQPEEGIAAAENEGLKPEEAAQEESEEKESDLDKAKAKFDNQLNFRDSTPYIPGNDSLSLFEVKDNKLKSLVSVAFEDNDLLIYRTEDDSLDSPIVTITLDFLRGLKEPIKFEHKVEEAEEEKNTPSFSLESISEALKTTPEVVLRVCLEELVKLKGGEVEENEKEEIKEETIDLDSLSLDLDKDLDDDNIELGDYAEITNGIKEDITQFVTEILNSRK